MNGFWILIAHMSHVHGLGNFQGLTEVKSNEGRAMFSAW